MITLGHNKYHEVHKSNNDCVQFDYLFWIPNASLLLVTPSPSAKGQSTQQTVLDALPTVGDTVKIAALIRLLSSKFTDMVCSVS